MEIIPSIDGKHPDWKENRDMRKDRLGIRYLEDADTCRTALHSHGNGNGAKSKQEKKKKVKTPGRL
jgi:hypothetical protein